MSIIYNLHIHKTFYLCRKLILIIYLQEKFYFNKKGKNDFYFLRLPRGAYVPRYSEIKPYVVLLFSLFSFLIFVDKFYLKKIAKFKLIIKLKPFFFFFFLECLSHFKKNANIEKY